MAAVGLIQTLRQAPHTFLQPSNDTAADAVLLAKSLLDPLAQDIIQSQTNRRDENRKKRKRGDDETKDEVLQLRSLYTKNLAVKQVWEQARRILEATCTEVERSLPEPLQTMDVPDDDISEDDGEGVVEDGELDEMLDESDLSELEVEEGGVEEELDDEDPEEEDIQVGEDDDLEDDISDEDDAEAENWAPDKHGLNDGFFSIDNFNKQSQFLEQMDARGEDDNPSDEDEVDWDADPMAQPVSTPNGRTDRPHADVPADEDSEAEEDGPTFGNADLNAPDSDEDNSEVIDDDEMDLEGAMPGLNNTNDIRYADFFAPPPKKLSKTKRMRALPKTQPPKSGTAKQANEDGMDEEMERAMNDVNRDIFASESEGSVSDSDASNPTSRNMSTHEKQRAKIASEIRRLEAASVAKRDWTLSGEARAADRPVNSLIEEDLEFERVGKPVPVVTAETSEEIEALIKRRILAREFDEVIRRHADSIGNSASDTRRGRIELDDTKPQSGLAERYEQEHLKATDPNYTDTRSKQTKKQHAEIEKLWRDVSYQLDLLSNLHFKPKRVEAEIKVVEDKPRIAMEDARLTGDGVGEESMLAPQEVYRAGEKKGANGEVMRKGGAAVNKEEMSREEKKRKRRREKERARKGKVGQGVEPVSKAVEGKAKKQKKSKADEKQGILEELKRGGVQVVGKKGELQNLDGKKGAAKGEATSSALKL